MTENDCFYNQEHGQDKRLWESEGIESEIEVEAGSSNINIIRSRNFRTRKLFDFWGTSKQLHLSRAGGPPESSCNGIESCSSSVNASRRSNGVAYQSTSVVRYRSSLGS